MTRFSNGPAKDQALMLIRTPIFLRVTEQDGKFDALNLPADQPRPAETLYAYLLTEHRGTAFIDGKTFRGRCPMVTYTLLDPQPSDAILRDNEAWGRWVDNAVTLKTYVNHSRLLAQMESPELARSA